MEYMRRKPIAHDTTKYPTNTGFVQPVKASTYTVSSTSFI